MEQRFLRAFVPPEAIDDHGTMIGNTNTIYYLGKSAFRDSWIMNLSHGNRKQNLYGELSLLDDADWDFLAQSVPSMPVFMTPNMMCTGTTARYAACPPLREMQAHCCALQLNGQVDRYMQAARDVAKKHASRSATATRSGRSGFLAAKILQRFSATKSITPRGRCTVCSLSSFCMFCCGRDCLTRRFRRQTKPQGAYPWVFTGPAVRAFSRGIVQGLDCRMIGGF